MRRSRSGAAAEIEPALKILAAAARSAESDGTPRRTTLKMIYALLGLVRDLSTIGDRVGQLLVEHTGAAGQISEAASLPHSRSSPRLIREAPVDTAFRPAFSENDPYRINGLVFDDRCDPSTGTVHWDTVRSIFNGSMLAAAIVLGPLYFTWSALGVFLVLCLFGLLLRAIRSAFIAG